MQEKTTPQTNTTKDAQVKKQKLYLTIFLCARSSAFPEEFVVVGGMKYCGRKIKVKMYSTSPMSSNPGQAHPSPEEFVVVGEMRYRGRKVTSNNVEIRKKYNSSPKKVYYVTSFLYFPRQTRSSSVEFVVGGTKYFVRKVTSNQVEIGKI